MFSKKEYRSSRRLALAVTSAALIAAAGVGVAAGADYMPTHTIREVMDSMVMPSADVLWNAVSVNVTASGIQETKPETDEDWQRIRWAAVTLSEATNVVSIPGRAVANPDPDEEVSEGDLSPAEIQAMLKTEWPAWIAHAQVLHSAAEAAVAAVDARDVDRLSEVGGDIDAACESCHVQFWYPNQ